MLELPLPVMCERLFWGQRGGFGAGETFEEQDKDDKRTNETKNSDDDDDGFAEPANTDFIVQK